MLRVSRRTDCIPVVIAITEYHGLLFDDVASRLGFSNSDRAAPSVAALLGGCRHCRRVYPRISGAPKKMPVTKLEASSRRHMKSRRLLFTSQPKRLRRGRHAAAL